MWGHTGTWGDTWEHMGTHWGDMGTTRNVFEGVCASPISCAIILGTFAVQVLIVQFGGSPSAAPPSALSSGSGASSWAWGSWSGARCCCVSRAGRAVPLPRGLRGRSAPGPGGAGRGRAAPGEGAVGAGPEPRPDPDAGGPRLPQQFGGGSSPPAPAGPSPGHPRGGGSFRGAPHAELIFGDTRDIP
ncbi:uncharacterized protein LOC144247954 [Lonchura striata]